MKAHAAYGRTGLKTTTVKTVILGGDEDYCAERLGYGLHKKGITPWFAAKELGSWAYVVNAFAAEYIPAYGKTMIVAKNGAVYFWQMDGAFTPRQYCTLSSLRPYVIPFVKNGNYAYAVYCGNLTFTIDAPINSNFSSKTAAHKIKSVALHCGRAYAVDYNDPYTLYWTGENVTDWSEDGQKGGHLKLDTTYGGIVDIVDMGDKLALVRETGVTVISVLNDVIHMRVESAVSRRLPPVTEGASVMCGNKLYIHTREGLYAYCDGNVTRVNGGYVAKGYHVIEAKQFNGNRILYTFDEDEDDSVYNKFFVEYDPEEDVFTPSGIGYHTMFLAGNRYYCFYERRICELSKSNADPDRRWVSKTLDLGTQNAKMLKYITVEGSGNPTVEIDCDGRKRKLTDFGRKRIGECGHGFTFTVTGHCEITRITAEWEVRS